MLRDRKRLTAMVTGWITLVGLAFAAPAEVSSPVGFWKTIDDVSGKPKSIIQIWQAPNQVLMGKVVRIFPKNGEDPKKKVCTACAGELHNQPVVGLVILKGLMPGDKQWVGGKILDPANGKTYNCSARLSSGGEKLRVRGFIGMPLFGRSQTWERVDLMSG